MDDGVADITLLPSGDQARRVMPPPPMERKGVHLSQGTFHAWKKEQETCMHTHMNIHMYTHTHT